MEEQTLASCTLRAGRQEGRQRTSAAYEPRLSPKDQERQQLLAKMHRSIAAVVERLKNKSVQPSAEEAGFVRNGKAEVQVWLSDKSAETIATAKETRL